MGAVSPSGLQRPHQLYCLLQRGVSRCQRWARAAQGRADDSAPIMGWLIEFVHFILKSCFSSDSFLGGAQASFRKRMGLSESYKWIANPSGSFKFEKGERWMAWLFSGVWFGDPPKLSCLLRYFLQSESIPGQEFVLPPEYLFAQGLGLFRLPSFGHFLH